MATLKEPSPSWGAEENDSASLFAPDQLNVVDNCVPKGPVNTYSAFELASGRKSTAEEG